MNSGIVKIVISLCYLSLLMAYLGSAQDPSITGSPAVTTLKAESLATSSGSKGTESISKGTESISTKAPVVTTPGTSVKTDGTPTTVKPTTPKSSGIRITGTGAALCAAMLVRVVYASL